MPKSRGAKDPRPRQGKRNVLEKFDYKVSKAFFDLYHKFLATDIPLVLLELSGHGIPWLAVTGYFLVWPLLLQSTQIQYLSNFLLGLVTDLICIGMCKVLFRRQRPTYAAHQKQMVTVEIIDQFSFPSGHTARVVFIACFVLNMSKSRSHFASVVTADLALAIVVWAGSVAWSRLALGRHYFSDVFVGAMIGFLNYELVVRYLWISMDTSMEYSSIVRDQISTMTR
eukprot:CFRG4710T1